MDVGVLDLSLGTTRVPVVAEFPCTYLVLSVETQSSCILERVKGHTTQCIVLTKVNVPGWVKCIGTLSSF